MLYNSLINQKGIAQKEKKMKLVARENLERFSPDVKKEWVKLEDCYAIYFEKLDQPLVELPDASILARDTLKELKRDYPNSGVFSAEPNEAKEKRFFLFYPLKRKVENYEKSINYNGEAVIYALDNFGWGSIDGIKRWFYREDYLDVEPTEKPTTRSLSDAEWKQIVAKCDLSNSKLKNRAGFAVISGKEYLLQIVCDSEPEGDEGKEKVYIYELEPFLSSNKTIEY